MNEIVAAKVSIKSLIEKQEETSDQAHKWLSDSVIALNELVNGHDHEDIADDENGILKTVNDSYAAFVASEIRLYKLQHVRDVLNEISKED